MRATTLVLVLALGLYPAAAGVAADASDLFDRVQHHTASSDGVKIHYVTLGAGPVVLFVHGFPDFWYTWRHQMAGLEDHFRCAAMDTRAYNKSDKPKGIESYDMDLLLADVEAVVDDLGVDKVTLVGHDWGGAIAWRFAMLRPERVERLVILNLTHPNGYLAVRQNATEEQQRNTQYIAEFQKPDAHLRFQPEMLARMAGGDDEAVQARYLAAFEATDFDGALNYYRAVWPRLTGEVVEEVPDVTVPVLQFHGLQDTAVDKQGLRDTWDWIASDYTLVTIPSSGHWVQRDAAELVTTSMKWWLLARR